MTTKRLSVGLLGLLTVMAVAVSGCYTAPPSVAVQSYPAPAVAPVPVPTTVTYVPDYYVWDGYEYVGVRGGEYMYWRGNTWIAADPVIVGRFHGWERYHPGWRRNALRYHYGGRPYR
jgi:hypothetical protein